MSRLGIYDLFADILMLVSSLRTQTILTYLAVGGDHYLEPPGGHLAWHSSTIRSRTASGVVRTCDAGIQGRRTCVANLMTAELRRGAGPRGRTAPRRAHGRNGGQALRGQARAEKRRRRARQPRESRRIRPKRAPRLDAAPPQYPYDGARGPCRAAAPRLSASDGAPRCVCRRRMNITGAAPPEGSRASHRDYQDRRAG